MTHNPWPGPVHGPPGRVRCPPPGVRTPSPAAENETEKEPGDEAADEAADEAENPNTREPREWTYPDGTDRPRSQAISYRS